MTDPEDSVGSIDLVVSRTEPAVGKVEVAVVSTF